MATLYERYITGDDHSYFIQLTAWLAQTFTVGNTGDNVDFISYSVKLKMYRTGSPGTITVLIRALDSDGKPTGSNLAIGTTNGNTLTTDSGGEWREIIFSSTALLRASTGYAIIAYAAVGGASRWKDDNTSPTYSGRVISSSGDSGATWTNNATVDFMFELYGNPQGSGSGGSIFPSDDVARVSSIRHIFKPGLFRMEATVGALGFGIDIAEESVRSELGVAKKPPVAPTSPAPTPAPAPSSAPVTAEPTISTTPGPPTRVGTPLPETVTQQVKTYQQVEAARLKAIELEVTPVTERTVQIFQTKPRETTLLQEIQILTKSASAVGITSYARQVLIQKIIQLKAELDRIYKGG